MKIDQAGTNITPNEAVRQETGLSTWTRRQQKPRHLTGASNLLVPYQFQVVTLGGGVGKLGRGGSIGGMGLGGGLGIGPGGSGGIGLGGAGGKGLGGSGG
ncbi:MAG: hypothetical protein H0X30_36810, partial [Anaerolineae bacterium]|nr:hypothetical protein [Anaerolineae bacterium]